LFVFFQNLVEAYTRVLIPRGGVKERLEDVVLRRSRAEYWHSLLVESVLKKQRDARLAAARAEEEADRNELASIDWRDFVVVQSIAFRDEDDPYLPAPCQTVEQMAAMLAATDLNAAGALPPVAEADMDMDTDEGQPATTTTTTTTTKPAAAAPAASTTTTSTAASAREQEEVAQLIRSSVVLPDDDEQLEIRAAPTDAAAKPRAAAVFQKCLVCGDEIAIDDLAEHMRIELLDPRWKEQKQALLDKQRESSLASDSIVSSNLARMARRVIGATDKEDQARKELQQRKQAAQDAAVIYGPHSQQAREAAARAGEVVLPPPPPKQPAAPAPAPAAPIGPTAYRPPAPQPGAPGAPTPSPSPPAAAAAAAASPAAAHRPLLSSPVVPAAGAPSGAPGAIPQQQPPRPGMPPGGAPMMRFGFPAVPTVSKPTHKCTKLCSPFVPLFCSFPHLVCIFLMIYFSPRSPSRHGFDEITIIYMHHHLNTIQARLFFLFFFSCFSSPACCWMGRQLICVLFGVFLQQCVSLKRLRSLCSHCER
jgi:splicing factor 3A subunit 1